MKLIPEVKYDPRAGVEDNLKALCNWLSFALRELTADTGRVEANRVSARQDAEAQQADTDEQTLDLSYRLSLIELGVN